MESGDAARAKPAHIHGAVSFDGVGRASPPRRAGHSLAARAGFVALALAVLLGLNAADPAGAAPQNFVVDDTRDLVDARVGQNGCSTAAGTCTLRAAIQEANATSDVDTIQLPAGVYAITIRGNSNTQGDFDITRPVTIAGAGAASTMIDGGQPPSGSPPNRRGLDRVFEIQSAAGNVTIAGVTIQEGYSAETGGGIHNASAGTVRLEKVIVRDSYAGKFGGGLNNVRGGLVQLVGTTFSGNAAVEGGSALNNVSNGTIEILNGSEVANNPGTYPLLAGAINNEGENNAIGAIVVRDSEVSGNQAIRNGAGISNDGDGSILVERSSITGNLSSGSGGGIYTVSGSVSVIDSTISDNQAGNDISTGNGGGIYNAGQLTKAGVPGSVDIRFATISGNHATGDGGGIASGLDADLILTDSIVTKNVADSDGGGVSGQSRASMVVARVEFLLNEAAVRAGGVYAYASEAVTVEDTLFSGNTALEEGGAGLYTDGSGTVSVRDSRFSTNVAGGDGGGVAIHSSGAVTIADSILNANRSLAGGGGGLENSGAFVSLTRVTVSDNAAFLDGGGIRSTSSGEFTILDTTVEGNTAENGGGLAGVADSTLVVRRSLFSGNTAEFLSDDPLMGPRSDTGLGGGIYSIADGDSLFENSTVSGNTAATAGGGIYNDADAVVRVVNVTISDNSAPRGAGFALEAAAPPSILVILRNTIVAANHVGEDCDGGLSSEGGNIDGGTSCQFHGPGDLSNKDPDLAPLADNGGPTRTHALNPGSPAVDAGVEPCLLTDQRGFARPPDACDIGAYELGASVDGSPVCVPGTVTLSAESDSWVLESSATSNYGSDTVLKVDSKSAGNARALVRFALAPSIPSGCEVTEAVLRLYASSYKEGRTLEALPLTETWSEAIVRWDSQPEPDDERAVTAPSGSGYVEWTFTSQEGMLPGANGFLIRDESEGEGGLLQGFNSREKALDNPPQLVVTFG